MQDTITHRHLTHAIVRLAARDPGYGEVAQFEDVMAQASVDEDERPRFLHHFYDPDTKRGLPVSTVFALYEALAESRAGKGLPPWDSSGATLEDSSSYVNALDWARGKAPGDMTWVGALKAYSESPEAKAKAYEALGHVLHLLEDMGQPDHVSLRAHPWEDVHHGAFGDDGRISYESLMLHAFSAGGWTRATKPRRVASLEEAFDDLARLSRHTEGTLGLPRRLDQALGVRFWKPYLRLPPDADTEAHLTLARMLLPEVEAFGAGLVQLFLRIVNPPPYLREVRVLQGGAMRYHKRWETESNADGRATRRRLATLAEEPLDEGIPAEIHLSFGPGADDAPRAVVVTRIGMEEGGAFTPIAGAGTPEGWRGAWTPAKGGRLVVEARDAEPHHDARPEATRGHVLQSTPEVPARVDPWDPLAWKGYAPGPDRTHEIQVRPPPCVPASFDGPERERLRWGEFRGRFRARHRKEEAWAFRPELRAVTETRIEAEGTFRVCLGVLRRGFQARPGPPGWNGTPPGALLQAGGFVSGTYRESLDKEWFDAFRPNGFDRHNPDVKRASEERSGPLRGGGGAIGPSGYSIRWTGPGGHVVELASDRVCEGPTLRGSHGMGVAAPLQKLGGFTYEGSASEWEWTFTFAPAEPPHAAVVRDREGLRGPGLVAGVREEVTARMLRAPAAGLSAGIRSPAALPSGPLGEAYQRALRLPPQWTLPGGYVMPGPSSPPSPSPAPAFSTVALDLLWLSGQEGEDAYAQALADLQAAMAARRRQVEDEREAWRKALAEVRAIGDMVETIDPLLAADLRAIAARPIP